MNRPIRKSAGFSLIELLIVVAVLSIVAVMLLPNSNTGISEQLEAAARILASDLDYAQGLAVAYNSKYKVTFDISAASWTLRHSGTDTALTTLPPSPVRSRQDASDRQTTALRSLPEFSLPVSLYSLYSQGSTLQAVTDVEFGPLGATTRASETVIWLSVGTGAAARYVDVRVNPVTGLTTIGTFQSAAPPAPTS